MVTVVTGASGFVGGVLVRALLEEGRQVRCIDLRRGPALDGLDVEFLKGDVLETGRLDEAFRDADVVYHLAAVISVTGDPTGRVWAINVDGVHNVATAALAAGVSRLVHCSSVHAFDLEATTEVSEQSVRSVAGHLPTYDRSKAAGEAALQKVIEQGLNAVIVNPTGVLGPYDFEPSRMGKVLLAMYRRRLPAVIEGGFDWIDVRDVASAMIAAEVRGRAGENYLLSGHHLSLADLETTVDAVAGHKLRHPITLSVRFARIWSPMADRLSRHIDSPLLYTSESLHALRFSPSVLSDKAERELGHHPRPMEVTIADTLAWFAERGIIESPGIP